MDRRGFLSRVGVVTIGAAASTLTVGKSAVARAAGTVQAWQDASNLFTGRNMFRAAVHMEGAQATFTNPYGPDNSQLYIAPYYNGGSGPAVRADCQGIQIQMRTEGANQWTQDALIAELRFHGSQERYMNAIEASLVVNGVAGPIPDARGITINLHGEGDSGSLGEVALVRTQQVYPGDLNSSVSHLVSGWFEEQTRGGTNHTLYAPRGLSQVGVMQSDTTHWGLFGKRVAKQSVTGSTTETQLSNLLTALRNYGLIM